VSAVENATVVVLGVGIIGSYLVTHLARMRGRIGAVRLVDPDVYAASNVGQDIVPSDVGQPKAVVQAQRLRQINPALEVTAIVDRLENVPLGALRADVLLGCLDSRAARRSLNLVAWRLGVPWIDAGVNGGELLARINVHVPGPGRPCLARAWDGTDYELLEQAYPCADERAVPATNAPSGLGALAASLQALECGKLLDGDHDRVAIGRQVTISALAHRHLVTRFAVNAACRFDHDVWRIATVAQGPEELTVRDAFALGDELDGRPRRLRVAHHAFVTALCCPACGRRRDVPLHLLARLEPAERHCADCGRAMRPAGTETTEWLPEADLGPGVLDAPLRRLGVRRGDVVTVADETHAAHFQLGAIA